MLRSKMEYKDFQQDFKDEDEGNFSKVEQNKKNCTKESYDVQMKSNRHNSPLEAPYWTLDAMNIQVIGRVRPMTRGEGTAIHVEGYNKVAARAGGPYFGFQELHTQRSTTYDVFKRSIQPAVDVFMGGCNACLLIGGESNSGKSFSMAGDGRSKAGLGPMIVDHVFLRLAKDGYSSDKKLSLGRPRVTIQMFEVYNEIIKDLMTVPVGGAGYVDLTETATKGVHVRNLTQVRAQDATQANSQFHQAWTRRTEESSDYGPAIHNAAVFFQIELEVLVGNSPQPYKSKFTLVELPGFEKLITDSGYLSLREGPDLSKALVGLSKLVTTLASHPDPDRVINYNDSKLTQLLQEELGGNCHTRALICLKPESNPDIVNAVVKFCGNLAQVKNFPVVNDALAQALLIQDRARLIDLKHQAGVGPTNMTSAPGLIGDPTSEIRRLQTENLVLKDNNERLQLRLNQLGNKFGQVAHNKTDLSQQLLLSEEEKLKVSQSLVEMQIENNKIKEEAEATNFELTNKIILLENQLVEAQSERDRYHKSSKAATERLNEMEADRKDLADEYVVLKTNYLALTNEHKKECTRNENLAIELLNLVNNKAALMRQVNLLTNDPSQMGDPNAEIDRVKAIVQQNTSGKIKADQILGSQKDREQVEDRLFASQRKFESQINRLKNDLGDEHKKNEGRMNSLMKELADTRMLARERQQKISDLSAKVITLRGEKEALETQCNRLQHKVKDLGEDFRARLVKYVEDIAEYVDKGSGVPGQAQQRRMRDYCDSMLKDIRRSHKEREDQLSQAAQTFKKRLQNAVHSYEMVLVAYRNLRQTCEARGFERVDLGPDENELRLGDTEIQSSHLKELDKTKGDLGKVKNENLRQTCEARGFERVDLGPDENELRLGDTEIQSSHLKELDKTKGDLGKVKNELDAIKLKYGLFGEDKKDGFVDFSSVSAKSDLWSALRKQLREFTLNTQQQLEQERARLLSENQVLQQQLKESQDYIDNHLVRYKQEIIRLRRLLGMSETDISFPTYKNKRR
ncbi:coiled-coil domain-containing protein 78-like isoform x1 [Plakobranchus ocellatus]|uniref:Coiled-coil domain-containing protein 78-like isoform x1 n=1 Tax=Plakobranchus ocellatus TaxID=259542 RepID=A0AAV4CXT1_9GAST|nr:coiled-coil domain-containing protein 78-like isoform x1 [Plakobranchus ocellatus]